MLEQHWLFVIFGVVVGLLMIRLIVRERITLQSSLAFLALLATMVLLAACPPILRTLTHVMGFDLPANFLFAVGLCALTLIHVGTMAALSKLELRSVALTQELGLLREHLGRHVTALEQAGHVTGAPGSAGGPAAPSAPTGERSPRP